MQKNNVNTTGSIRNLKALAGLVKESKFEETIDILTRTQETELEEQEKERLLESVLFWKGKMDAAGKMERYAGSEFLILQWEEFVRSSTAAALPELYAYALKHCVYRTALGGYLELYNLSGIADTITLTKMGRLYKGLGDYTRAIESLELAHGQAKYDPRILFLLGDCYAQVDLIKEAKLFYREAFFLDPAAFDLNECEAAFIRELISLIRMDGHDESVVSCWIPVYATLRGVFSVTRELKPVEIGRLTQSVRELEKRCVSGSGEREKALLLNRYFWLVDHELNIKAPKEEIDEILEKIKRLDRDIFERYVQ